MKLQFSVNGSAVVLDEVHPLARLLDVLRENVGLTGTKEGCGEGECGACSVLVDGKLVQSCLVPALQVAGARVTTIEGIAAPGPAGPELSEAELAARLSNVQRAFLECGGAQCGICTPGMVLAAHALLAEKPQPTEAEIREGLAGNLCRCTGYTRIFTSVVRACQGATATATGSERR